MILMMRCGGFPSFLTVAISPEFIVFSAASASSSAGRATSNFPSATALSAEMHIEGEKGTSAAHSARSLDSHSEEAGKAPPHTSS